MDEGSTPRIASRHMSHDRTPPPATGPPRRIRRRPWAPPQRAAARARRALPPLAGVAGADPPRRPMPAPAEPPVAARRRPGSHPATPPPPVRAPVRRPPSCRPAPASGAAPGTAGSVAARRRSAARGGGVRAALVGGLVGAIVAGGVTGGRAVGPWRRQGRGSATPVVAQPRARPTPSRARASTSRRCCNKVSPRWCRSTPGPGEGRPPARESCSREDGLVLTNAHVVDGAQTHRGRLRRRAHRRGQAASASVPDERRGALQAEGLDAAGDPGRARQLGRPAGRRRRRRHRQRAQPGRRPRA